MLLADKALKYVILPDKSSSNANMKCKAMLNSINTIRLSTFLMLLHNYDQTRLKTGDFRDLETHWILSKRTAIMFPSTVLSNFIVIKNANYQDFLEPFLEG